LLGIAVPMMQLYFFCSFFVDGQQSFKMLYLLHLWTLLLVLWLIIKQLHFLHKYLKHYIALF